MAGQHFRTLRQLDSHGHAGEHSEWRAATVLLVALALTALLAVVAFLRPKQNQLSATGTKTAPVKFFRVGCVVRRLAFSQLFQNIRIGFVFRIRARSGMSARIRPASC